MAAGVGEGFVEADGLGIRYMEAGEGPALARAGTSAIGASRPLRRIPTIVSFLNTHPALILVCGNRSCPIAVIASSQSPDLSGWKADLRRGRPRFGC